MGTRVQPLRVADLFCGAGGLSQGFTDAGFEIALALDRDADSCETFRLNHPEAHVIHKGIAEVQPEEIAEVGDIDIIVGGPSCQSFSTAGRLGRAKDPKAARWVRPGDPRSELWRHMLRVVKRIRPKVFLLENVPGLVYWKEGTLGGDVLKGFAALGYAVDLQILLAADFGVPQRRRRLFVVGFLESDSFRWPIQTHMGGWRRDTLDLWEERRVESGKLPHVTCWETIRDLPPLIGVNGVPETSYEGHRSTSPISTWLRNRSRVLRDHEVSPISSQHAELLSWVPVGGTWRDIPPHLLPERFRGIRRTDSTNLYGRLDPNLPAYTLSTQFNNPSAGCFTHPFADRTLSMREGARLQTFPDTYRFVGSIESRCRQIGNAVPPLLASVLANAVADQLHPRGRRPAWRKNIEPMRPTYAQPSDRTRARMRRQRRADTGPEVAIRSLLHRRGLRFRKQMRLLGDRRSVDIVFPSQRLAVSIFGCFWHGCPEHSRPTKSNTVWWAEKIANNQRRDAQTKQELQGEGWLVLEFWEHEAPESIADLIENALEACGKAA